MADGVVATEEAAFLGRWLERNRHVRSEWPANVLYERIREMLSDKVLDEEEQRELLDLLSDITGEGESLQYDAPSLSSKLPLTAPPPTIEFEQSEFCLTGRFVFGTRRECEAAVRSRGGVTKSSPTLATRYLVIGHIGSTDWIHSTHGRKIERAIELESRGTGIALVAEEHWIKYVTA